MKKLNNFRRRIVFHFGGQLLIGVLFTLSLLGTISIGLIIYLAEDELQNNFSHDMLETIDLDTYVTEESVEVESEMLPVLKRSKLFLQIVNVDGTVIYDYNVPKAASVKRYSEAQLQQIRHVGRLNDYEFRWITGTSDEEILYVLLLGQRDQLTPFFATLIEQYNDNGTVQPQRATALTKVLRQNNSQLAIFAPDGSRVQQFNSQRNLGALDQLLGGYRSSDQSTSFRERQVNEYKWLILQHNKQTKQEAAKGVTLYKQIIRWAIFIDICLFLLLVLYSIWYAWRYSRPLFFFVRWLERLSQQNFRQVITDEEQQKMYKANGQLRGKFKLYEDVIQSFHQLGHSLASAEDERAELERIREEWMTGISHDLRTPLATIKGYGHFLESDHYEFSAAEVHEMGGVIRERSEYMQHLLDDFSLIYQLKNSVLPLQREDVSLTHFVRDHMKQYVHDRTIEGVDFVFVPPPRDLVVSLDQRLIVRVLNNIYVNALKHNDRPLTLTTTILLQEDGATIRIADNGKGMSAETVRQLFTKYYRGTNTVEATDGSGLGMSIAKAIVTAHQGEIEAISREGEGTTIAISLPYR